MTYRPPPPPQFKDEADGSIGDQVPELDKYGEREEDDKQQMPNDEKATIQEFPFPWPNADKGYDLFDKELEDDELVAFHGTSKRAA